MSLLLKVPKDVHDEIFLKLPAKSILVSRCVCKFLYNQLSKPSFIKNHVNRHRNNNPKLLFNNSDQDKLPIIYSLPIDYPSISSSQLCEPTLINYPFESKNSYSFEFVGSCNGLVCLTIDGNHNTRFSIWNPLTREFKETSRPPYDSGIVCGFGYDSNIDDYKLVIISDYFGYGKTSPSKIEVYTVRSDSWSNIQSTVNYSIHPVRRSHGVFFNGALHWLGMLSLQKPTSEVIFSFDISNGTMMDIPLPENVIMQAVEIPTGEKNISLRLWGDSFCIAFVCGFVRVDIWVMQEYGVKESWIKKYTTTSTQLPSRIPYWKPLWCFENGKILVEYCLQDLLLCDQTNERVDSVVVRSVVVGVAPGLNNRESYVESIVSLGSGTYLETNYRVMNPE